MRALQRVPQVWFELALAVGLTVAALLELVGHDLLETAPQAVAAALVTLPIAVRFRWPVAALAVVCLAWVAETALGIHSGDIIIPQVAVLLALYAVGSRTRGVAFWASGVFAVCALTTQLLIRERPGFDLITGVAGVALGLLIGRALGTLTFETDVLEERASTLERERDDQVRQAVAEERGRIARELHDVIGHSISVMGVQAGAVRRRLRDDQELDRELLLGVERTGREAVGEMRRLIGLLRQDPGGINAPSPSLRRIGELAAEMREAGLDVTVGVDGSLEALPPGVDLAAYRIVQEALTNVLKHAPAAHVHVAVSRTNELIELEVIDDGTGTGASANGHVGHGLVGMRERAALYGGEISVGFRREGGFCVHATIPLGASA